MTKVCLAYAYIVFSLTMSATPGGCGNDKGDERTIVEQYKVLLAGLHNEKMDFCEAKGFFYSTESFSVRLKKNSVLNESVKSMMNIYARRLLLAYKVYKSSDHDFPIQCIYKDTERKNCYWHTFMTQERFDREIRYLESLVKIK